MRPPSEREFRIARQRADEPTETSEDYHQICRWFRGQLFLRERAERALRALRKEFQLSSELIDYFSPRGAKIVGTYARVMVRADIVGFDPDTGEPEFEGYTEVFWDTQETVERDGKPLYLDEDGYEWTVDQIHSDDT